MNVTPSGGRIEPGEDVYIVDGDSTVLVEVEGTRPATGPAAVHC